MLPLQGGTGSIPGQGTKILHAAWHGQKKKKKMTEEDFSLFESEQKSGGNGLKLQPRAGEGQAPQMRPVGTLQEKVQLVNNSTLHDLYFQHCIYNPRHCFRF